MSPDELLRRYDEQLRAEAEVYDADEVVRIGPLLAASFPKRGRGFVTYREIPVWLDLAPLVARVVQHYASDERIDHFEWKTRGHDPLPELRDLLEGAGFVFEDEETVMAGTMEAVIAAGSGLPAGYSLERVDGQEQMRAAEALAGAVFGDAPDDSLRRADELVARFEADPDSFEMWLVRDGSGEVVCSGRVDFVPGTDFAGLWGGACDERHRGKGLYRAITAERARSAKAHGKKYLQSDCTEYSRPILARAGLVPITTTTPAVWHS